MTETTARDAATVMPLRTSPDGFEVFMVRRHGDSAFMANRYVYPGGTLDPEDCTERAAEHVDGLTVEEARARFAGDVDSLEALGLHLAGVRETFEEAGILLARPGGDREYVTTGADDSATGPFERAREALQEGKRSLTDLLEAEGLIVPLDRLIYVAHWITPYAEDRRYDTRFFAVEAPSNQRARHDDRETTDGEWLAPEEALARNRAGDLQLAPPTLLTLRRLADADSIEAALDEARRRQPPAILPHMEMTGDAATLYLPGDPEFPSDDPRYAASDAPDDLPTRLRATAPGRWEAVEP